MFVSLINALDAFNAVVTRFCNALLVGLLTSIVVILAGSVFWRYFLNDPITWSEDASLFCMVWMTLLGAAPALRRGEHVAMDAIIRAFPDFFIPVFKIIINGVVLTTATAVVYYGFPFVTQGMARIIPSMDWLSQGYVYLALPVGYSLLIPICVENILRAISGQPAQET